MAAANAILPEFLRVPKIELSSRATDALQALEMVLSRASGLLDAGGHLLAVATRPGLPA
jgi:hypothetical protein